jgi:ABC-2 type transport system permease protein
MTATTVDQVVAPRDRAAPSLWRVSRARGALEIRQFFRERDAVVFTFCFPIMFLLLFSAIFHNSVVTGISERRLYLPAMIAAGVASTSFLSLGIGIAGERDDGTLKRLLGTPMPKAAYFFGKVAMVSVVGFIETAILVAVGLIVFGVPLPSDPSRWITLVWVCALGLVACSLLGVAVSSLPRSGRSATAVINLPFVMLEFVSGVFVPFSQLPHPVQELASFFPLKWMAEGLRSAFLPSRLAQAEMGHAWQHGTTALVLLAWCGGGLVLCLVTFRWRGRDQG